MTDIQIMNYFLKKKKDKELKYGELTVTKAGEIQVDVGEYDGSFFTPEYFDAIKTDIGRSYQIKTNSYSGNVTLIIQSEEIGERKS